jgi:hypothetical protein
MLRRVTLRRKRSPLPAQQGFRRGRSGTDPRKTRARGGYEFGGKQPYRRKAALRRMVEAGRGRCGEGGRGLQGEGARPPSSLL